MKALIISLAILAGSAFAQVTIPAQEPAKPQPLLKQEEQEPEQVFRINTKLVQIDVVITGKGNAHVDDLKEEDFELSVDGKKQSLSYFRLVKIPVNTTATEEKPKKNTLATTALPPTTGAINVVTPEQVHRTVAFVVDDLGMSFESTHYAREALKKFVNTQMQDGDLVGIIRTGKGMGALQQFTTDRRLLLTAIEKLSWNPWSRDMMPRFGREPATPVQVNDSNEVDQAGRNSLQQLEAMRETIFTVGTLGAVNFVVRGLRELPGRKMVVLLSDGIRLVNREPVGSRSTSPTSNSQVVDSLRRLTDLANRSSVVIYALDTRGLQTLQADASADFSEMTQEEVTNQQRQNAQDFFDSQSGLISLAQGTGGFALLNNNDINRSVTRVMKDNESYYLLGFDPDDEQFNPKSRSQFHNIKVKVKRPGVQVRTRAGYYGIPETATPEKPKTQTEQILHALYSPFGARDLSLQMTSIFYNTEKGGSFVRSYLHIEPDKLTFTEAPNGEKHLKLDIASFTFDENGKAIESAGRTFEMEFDQKRFAIISKLGLLYQNDTPIKKPGAYQFRMVLRDPASEKLGSAGQFINVPDLGKNRLALSGLTLLGRANTPASAAPNATAATTARADGASGDDPLPTPSVRRFAQNGVMEYWGIIFNPQLDKQTNKPQLSMQVEIYRDGKAIFQSAAREVDLVGQPDLKRIVCGGELKLNGLSGGDYLLHLIVTDSLTKQKYSHADQWMDFSVR